MLGEFFMRTIFKQSITFILFVHLHAQNDVYRNTDAIKTEWQGYSTYQKDEALSFCDFLFIEGQYERCLLNAFQILYKFPNDSIVSNVNYYIGRCYEEMDNYKLAINYYEKIINKEPKNNQTYKASFYRNIYCKLMLNEINDVLYKTNSLVEDPYLLTLRGYAYLKSKNWAKARTTFISAQSYFSHPHYDQLFIPLYQTIEDIYTVPKHNRYFIFLLSTLFPGAGQFMLGNKNQGQGIFSSVSLMILVSSWTSFQSVVGSSRAIDDISLSVPVFNGYINKETSKKVYIPEKIYTASSSSKYLAPPIFIGSSIFIASAYKSFKDTKIKNEELLNLYIQKKIDKFPPRRFLDFSEPQLVNN